MKKLILALLPFSVFAQEMDLSDNGLKRKFVTEVKELEIERVMKGSQEFQKCREMNKFEDSKDPAKKSANLTKATDCFNQQLKNVKGEKLIELSKKLELETYGIVKSKNTAEISKYLSKKMAKALTGYDPDELKNDPEKLKESLQWKNQKVLDQKMFIDLYEAQLAKNALLEISRYCFQNLRRKDVTQPVTNFQDHWGSPGTWPAVDETNVDTLLSDHEDKPFMDVKPDTNLSKPDEIYKSIQQGISSAGIDAAVMEKYFNYCAGAIKLLCGKFKQNTKDKAAAKNESVVGSGEASSLGNGANACLTTNRLQSIRTAITQTEKLNKEMEKLNSQEEKLSLLIDAKVFIPGQDGAPSKDDLTSASGLDAISGMQNDEDFAQKKADCQQDASGSDCEGYLQDGDSYYKALHATEMEANLKREVALARLEELKKDKLKLQDYLWENGYVDLAQKMKDGVNVTDAEIEEAIKNHFNARKTAEIQALTAKMGKRQMKDEEGKDVADKGQRTADAMEDSRKERARLAQVVMFNNIISSYLNVEKKVGDKTEKAGRNVTGLKHETKAMEQAGLGSSSEFFQNLKDTVDKEDNNATKDSNISGLGVLDVILGNRQRKDGDQ